MRITVLVVVSALAIATVWVRSRPPAHDASYVGSASCASCHAGIYRAWEVSQHTKMMRPVDAAGVVVADFGSDDPGLRFHPVDAVWAIGGKWEQQFMGHDGEGETLLPGSWHVLAKQWDFKGWDGWQVPIPRRRCHGCHTVGLEPETGEFVETNIGCESCHGPGSWHAQTLGLGQIHSSLDAQVCGQCHTRGQSPSGEYFFPVGYRPGMSLDDHFEESTPSMGQNSSYWWGNGRPRQRHQEHAAWRKGGHASSIDTLGEEYDGRFGEVTPDCLRCHAGEGALWARNHPNGGANLNPVTCSVCHNVHGDLTQPRLECGACHEGGAFTHTPERNDTHVPCPDSAEVSCVDCHMPKSVMIGGAYLLRDHSPGVIAPQEGERWSMPSSCANGGCHASTPAKQLADAFERFY